MQVSKKDKMFACWVYHVTFTCHVHVSTAEKNVAVERLILRSTLRFSEIFKSQIAQVVLKVYKIYVKVVFV